MKKWNKPIKTGLIALSLCAVGFGINAIAAPPDQGGPGYYGCDQAYGGGHGMGRGHGMGPRGYGVDPRIAEVWKERMAQRQAEIVSRLNLNSDQQAAWQAYTASVNANFGTFPRMNPEEFAKMTSPERMEKMLELMKERNSRMSDHLSKLKTFYGKLSSEQQKAFDAETLNFHPYYRGGRGPGSR